MNIPPKAMASASTWRPAIPALLEFVLIAAIYVADWNHYIVPSKVPYLFVIAWVSLRLRHLGWSDVGFRLYRNWRTTLLVGVAAGVGLELLELLLYPASTRSHHRTNAGSVAT